MHEIDLALLILRVAAGLTMAYHGFNKSKGLAGTAKWFESMGMRPGKVHAPLAACTEIGAGFGMAVGFLTPLTGAAFIGLMLVAGIVAHRKNGFFIFNKGEGWEYVMMLGVVGLFLAMTGAGRYSLDRAFDISFSEWVGTAIAAGGALGGAALLAFTWRPNRKTAS
jgi:putative oxidoreductase